MLKNKKQKLSFLLLLSLTLIISTYFLASKALNYKKSQTKFAKLKLSANLKNQRKPEALIAKTNVEKAIKKETSPKQETNTNTNTNTKTKSEQKAASKKAKTSPKQMSTLNKTKKISKNKSSKNVAKDKTNKCSVSLLINKGAGPKTYPAKLVCSSTVFDLLKIASAQYGFSLKYKNYSFGVFITEIDGLKEDKASSMYWLYYINGNLANKGVSEKKINEGDEILWKYERTN